MKLLYVVTGALLTVAFIRLLQRFALPLHLVDLPNARKRHFGQVPLVGGLAMCAALAITCGLFGSFADIHEGFFVGGGTLLFIGVIDDRWTLPAKIKFLLQAIAVSSATVGSGNVLASLGQVMGPDPIVLGVLSVPITVFALLGIINAVNLIDGADGLAGGIVFTALGWFFVVIAMLHVEGNVPAGLPDPSNVLLVLMGVVLGFLAFNMRTPWRSRAGVFMGDGGSLFLGFVAGWFAVATSSQYVHSVSPVTALWILIVPLFDTVACIIRRLASGRSPLRGDCKHVHHLLKACHLETGQVVPVLIGVNAMGGLIGVTGWRMGVADDISFAAFVTCFLAYMLFSTVAWDRIAQRKGAGRRTAPAISRRPRHGPYQTGKRA